MFLIKTFADFRQSYVHLVPTVGNFFQAIFSQNFEMSPYLAALLETHVATDDWNRR
jgi:hypothetical protein